MGNLKATKVPELNPLCDKQIIASAFGQLEINLTCISKFSKLPLSPRDLGIFVKILIKNDFLKHKQANSNVESRRFGVIMTPFSRQSEEVLRRFDF